MSNYFYYVFVRKHTAVYICAPHVLPKSESLYICINNVSFNLKSRKCCKVYIQCTHVPFKGHSQSSSSWYNNSNTRLPLCMPKKVPFTLHAELLYTLWQLSAFYISAYIITNLFVLMMIIKMKTICSFFISFFIYSLISFNFIENQTSIGIRSRGTSAPY